MILLLSCSKEEVDNEYFMRDWNVHYIQHDLIDGEIMDIQADEKGSCTLESQNRMYLDPSFIYNKSGMFWNVTHSDSVFLIHYNTITSPNECIKTTRLYRIENKTDNSFTLNNSKYYVNSPHETGGSSRFYVDIIEFTR